MASAAHSEKCPSSSPLQPITSSPDPSQPTSLTHSLPLLLILIPKSLLDRLGLLVFLWLVHLQPVALGEVLAHAGAALASGAALCCVVVAFVIAGGGGGGGGFGAGVGFGGWHGCEWREWLVVGYLSALSVL